jgi:predicted small lipoprotein YifL
MPIIIVPENRSALYFPDDDVVQRPRPVQQNVEKPRLRL